MYTAVTGEESHPRYTRDALLYPCILVLVRFVHQRMCLHITVEVVGYKVIITLVNDAITERSEAAGVAEAIALNGIKDPRKVWVESEVAVVMGVA